MASLVGVCGGVPGEKALFFDRVRSEPDPFEGLIRGAADLGSASLFWAAPPSAPISHVTQGNSSQWTLGLRTEPYWAAVEQDSDDGVTIRTDDMCLFPIYYHATGDRLIFSSTPSIFDLYPGFQKELCYEGLIGILLINFIVGGRTLLKGVRRLPSGCSLQWKKGSGAEEIKRSWLVPSDRYFGNSFEKNLEIIDGAFTSAIRKIKTEDPMTLLSGGLDSRLLAGYLAKVHGRQVRSITQGSPADFEMKCAKSVSKTLGWEHEAVPIEPATFEHYAMLKIKYENLAHGFNTPYFMQLVPRIRSSGAARIFSGVHGDAALGCGAMSRVFAPDSGYEFEPYVEHLNHSEFSTETIRRLIPKEELKKILEESIEKLRGQYNAYPGRPFQRAWLYELAVADRMQVGFIPRMLAFGAWPALPFLDKDLLTAVSGMPYEHIAHRRMEREIVCRKFPALAVLPLDRNNYNTTPVLGLKKLLGNKDLSFSQAGTLLLEQMKGRSRALLRRIGPANGKSDRRFYYQTFNINSPAWKGFRKKAEGSRASAENFFNKDVLAEFWPGPETLIRTTDGITDTDGIKVLLAFALWAEANLSKNRV